MFKTFAFAAVASQVNGAASDFPKFDALHANCGMTTTYDAPCDQVFGGIKEKVNAWGTGGPAGGLYSEKESADNVYLWCTRTTPKAHYVDDIIFEVQAINDSACHVSSKSRSQSLSYYDYETNFCNQWNVLSRVGTIKTLTPNHCNFQPDNNEERCAKY
jgi:hypothetical protein